MKASDCIPQASDLGAGAVDAALIASTWTVRGPITLSTTLCAIDIPVPQPKPIKQEGQFPKFF